MTTKMRPFKGTISLDEAKTIIERAITPITRVERLPLERAAGRVLAETITSSADVPPFSRAAMDGYAVRAEDTAGASRTAPRTLRRIEKVFTGQMPVHRPGGHLDAFARTDAVNRHLAGEHLL